MSSWCFRRRWWAISIWIVVLVGANVAGGVVGSSFSNAFELPGTESGAAIDLLEEKFSGRAGGDAVIVYQAPNGVDDPLVRERIEASFDQLSALGAVVTVVSPYVDPEAAEFVGPVQISEDGTIAYATILFAESSGNIDATAIKEVKSVAELARGDDLIVEVGGQVIAEAEQQPPGVAEVVGFVAAMLVLLIAFGSLLGMVFPLVIALFGIGVGLAILTFLTHILNTPEFAPQLATMIGIAVGIDYALFIVTRFREGLRAGLDPEAASANSMRTAGRTVVFAGIIVVISLLGMLFMRFNFLEGLAVGAACVVFVTMIASVTLLPAFLGFAGHNIDKLRVPLVGRTDKPHEQTFWYRWSRVVQRRPAIIATMSLLILLALAAPVVTMRLGVADAGNDPVTYSTRRAYDLLAKGFGPGFNGQVIVVAEVEGPADLPAIERLRDAIAGTGGVAAVGPPVPNPEGTAVIIALAPAFAPQDVETTQLIENLRNVVIPEALEGSGVTALAGGFTAIGLDFSTQASERLPVLIGVVIAVSFLLLMIVFRSLLVPLKAALMNLLSIGAAYGVIVAIFQWGWFADVIGVGRPGPIEAWAPMMLFAILFGLSMDYEVFLLSRVQEEYSATGDNALSVANGLARTARVITAAAAIMIMVFLSFVFGGDLRQIKLFGIGLAVAIFIDVTLVRMVLVPSTMELLGDANWWLPNWLDRILPNVSIEGVDLVDERRPETTDTLVSPRSREAEDVENVQGG